MLSESEKEAIEVVDRLNNKLDKCGYTDKADPPYAFEFVYMTHWSAIKWGDNYLWDSEDDYRKWIERFNCYENLEKFVVREFNKIRKNQNSIKL